MAGRQKSKFKIWVKRVLWAMLLVALVVPAGGFVQGAVVPDYTGNTTGIPVPWAWNPLTQFGPAGRTTATGVIIGIIQIALWIVGIISVLFVIIGGFRYVTAHGNEEQAEAAKKTITHAIIGVVIVILAFVIIRVISAALILGPPFV